MGLTQGSLVTDGIAQEIARAHGGQLRETFHEPLGLGAFSNARRTDENDASGAFELLGGHSKVLCSRYAQWGSRYGWLERDPGVETLLVGGGRSSRLRGYIYYGLMFARGM